MTKALIKFDDFWKFDEYTLSKLDTSDMMLFFVMASKFAKKRNNSVTFSFKQLAKLFPYLDQPARFAHQIETTYSRLIDIVIYFENQRYIIKSHLFRKFDINWQTNQVTLVGFSETQGPLNQLIENRASNFNLWVSAHLKNHFARELFLFIKQNKEDGWLNLSFDSLRHLLRLDSNFRFKIADAKIIQPIQKELSPYFKNLKFIPTKHGGPHKNANKIDHYHIVWIKETRPENMKKPKEVFETKS